MMNKDLNQQSHEEHPSEGKIRRALRHNPFHSSRPRRFRFRRPRRTENINLIFLLPNALTSMNLACGAGTVLFAIGKQFEIAATLILCAAFFDLIDGKVARKLKVNSFFGIQFDSIADVISFGIAPPILLHTMLYSNLSRLGVSVVLIYTLCTALRLARYNVQAMSNQNVKRKSFVGLPCPVPACFMAALVLVILEYGIPLQSTLNRIALHVLMVCLSGLMVSTIPYPDMASWKLDRKNIDQYNVFIVLLLCVTILRFKAVLLIMTGAFLLSGPLNAIQTYYLRHHAAQTKETKSAPLPMPPASMESQSKE